MNRTPMNASSACIHAGTLTDFTPAITIWNRGYPRITAYRARCTECNASVVVTKDPPAVVDTGVGDELRYHPTDDGGDVFEPDPAA